MMHNFKSGSVHDRFWRELDSRELLSLYEKEGRESCNKLGIAYCAGNWSKEDLEWWMRFREAFAWKHFPDWAEKNNMPGKPNPEPKVARGALIEIEETEDL